MTEIIWTPTTVALSTLKPWERNPKRISKTHAARLLELWKEIGQFQTIAIGPNGEVYDGHQRLAVLKAKHGAGYMVQALQASRPLTEAEREELTIAAHSGTTGSWDWDALAGWDVGNLTAWGLDEELLSDWNAGATALREMLAAEAPATGEDPGAQVDKAEELRVKWGVEPGQLWQLGEHRLICGDCTDAATVARVMGGEDVQMLATDPPFAITGSATGAEDMSGINIIRPFYQLWIGHFAALMPLFAHAYICCDFRTYSMIDSTAQQHLRLKNCVIWDKGGGGLGSMYQNCHEMIWFGVREERKRIKANKTGQRTVTGEPNIWRYTPPTFATGKDAPLHTANKPLEMFERMIRNSSDSNDIVADPFSGSGTTLIACENLGRRCRAVEIAPGYVAVALERWATQTGQTPVLMDGAP